MAAPAPRDGRAVLHIVMAALLGLFVAAAIPAVAWAADPPNVTGMSLVDTERALQKWDRSVIITYVPSLKELPAEIDQSRLVAANARWLNPDPIDSVRPEVEVALGATVPNLTSLTTGEVTTALTQIGLRYNIVPAMAADNWFVTAQRPVPGTVVLLRSQVTAVFEAPPVVAATTPPPPLTPTPTPRPRFGPVAAAAGTGLVVLLLLLLGTWALRRRLRRARDRADDESPPERIEARAHAGPPPGVTVTEAPGGSPVAVRLIGGYGPATATIHPHSLEEEHR